MEPTVSFAPAPATLTSKRPGAPSIFSTVEPVYTLILAWAFTLAMSSPMVTSSYPS